MKSRTLAVVIAVLVIAVSAGLMACSSGGTSPKGSVTVTIKDLQFRPSVVRVPKGGTVRWLNKDTTAHTSTSANFDPEATTTAPGSWNSPVLNPGSSWSKKFEKTGKFPYGCSIHPYIKGTVVVEGQ